jgi:hypothetical protein
VTPSKRARAVELLEQLGAIQAELARLLGPDEEPRLSLARREPAKITDLDRERGRRIARRLGGRRT